MKWKISIIMLLSVFFCFAYLQINAETMKNGCLYVNNSLVNVSDTVIFKENCVLLPFRTILEAIGATVEWNEDTNTTEVRYNNQSYICYIGEPNPGYSKYFYVKYMDGSKNKYSDNHIYLSSMSLGGAYEMINDRTYLYKETGRRLFEALGCKVEIDSEKKEVHIFADETTDTSAITGTN